MIVHATEVRDFKWKPSGKGKEKEERVSVFSVTARYQLSSSRADSSMPLAFDRVVPRKSAES